MVMLFGLGDCLDIDMLTAGGRGFLAKSGYKSWFGIAAVCPYEPLPYS